MDQGTVAGSGLALEMVELVCRVEKAFRGGWWAETQLADEQNQLPILKKGSCDEDEKDMTVIAALRGLSQMR